MRLTDGPTGGVLQPADAAAGRRPRLSTAQQLCCIDQLAASPTAEQRPTATLRASCSRATIARSSSVERRDADRATERGSLVGRKEHGGSRKCFFEGRAAMGGVLVEGVVNLGSAGSRDLRQACSKMMLELRDFALSDLRLSIRRTDSYRVE